MITVPVGNQLTLDQLKTKEIGKLYGQNLILRFASDQMMKALVEIHNTLSSRKNLEVTVLADFVQRSLNEARELVEAMDAP
jgi:hypothetical protein